MDTADPQTNGHRFLLKALALSVGLFGLLRLPWIESHIVLPLTHGQSAVALRVFGDASSPIQATLACSGTDAIALCLGVILAYPTPWRSRLVGVAGGLVLILVLNTMRIGTLGRVAASPEWFNALHLYVWPTVLTIAIAGYVFAWMRLSDPAPGRTTPSGPTPPSGRVHPSHTTAYASSRFIALSLGFLVIFVLAAPIYLESGAVLAAGGFIARVAATSLTAAGITAHASGNILVTARGGFLVTQECIVTPLIPIFLAFVVAYATSWRWLALGLAAAVPLFVVLGIARLMVVVVPVSTASPAFLVHAFFQGLTGVVVVVAAALWHHRDRTALPYAAAGVMVGALCVVELSTWSAGLVTHAAGRPINDPQDALAFLPAFQIGLYVALWIVAFRSADWRRGLVGLLLLLLTQAVGLLILHVLTRDAGLTVYAPATRAWAVVGPVLTMMAVIAMTPTPVVPIHDPAAARP